jgi:MFS family permease
MVITYLDRVCISVAGPRIQDALHIDALHWGWVTGIFTVSYAAFEIPSGVMGDRLGPRRVLTRIVLWWSGFTAMTGAMTGLYPMLITRFLFGIGEAGAFPVGSIVLARWFPVRERGRACGIMLAASQIGGAFTPLLVVPIQARFGWRASFYVFAVLGIVWAAVWYLWFRDSPAAMQGISQTELADIRGVIIEGRHSLPWRTAALSGNFWAILAVAYCYIYTFYFFLSWFHTYLVKARGFSERDLLLSSMPFFVAGSANLAGAFSSYGLVRKLGLVWGRRWMGIAGLTIAGTCATAVMFTHDKIAVLVLLSMCYAGITYQQVSVIAVCLDIGGEFAGAMVGAMNTSSQIGSFTSSLLFGYLVDRYANYDLPFVPMAALLFLGAALWLKIDPCQKLVPTERPARAAG